MARSSTRASRRADDAEDEREEREEPRRKKIKTLDVEITGREELRGGSQLVRITNDSWLGIGHAMKVVEKRKYYWHVWYLVDGRGKRKSMSPPMKLVPTHVRHEQARG